MTAKSTGAARKQPGPRAGSAVVGVVEKIREMLASMELFPGQPLRQEALAAQLGVSRVPVREALRALEREGILRHEPNVGYSVTRLTADELRQIYQMRHVLETEILRALPPASKESLEQLTRINEQMAAFAAAGDILALRKANHDFHFAMFRASGLQLIVDEVERIWHLSDAYRSVYMYDAAARQLVVHEHAEMIEGWRRQENEVIIELMKIHRVEMVDQLTPMLKPRATKPGA